jgi:hypothetical protein
LFCIIIALFNGLLRNLSALPVICFSLAQYLGIIVAAVVGYYFIRSERDILKITKVFVFTELFFLSTVWFHYLGYESKWPILKTMKIEGAYVHWHAGDALTMLNGLFKNPEPMGWHAMIVAICCVYLLVKENRSLFWKISYALLSLYGLFCVLASGRRKFFVGFIVFTLIFLFLIMKKNVKKMASIFVLLLVVFGLGWRYFESRETLRLYLKTAESAYFQAEDRLKGNMLGSIKWAIQRDGAFGRGLGASTQGSTHFETKIIMGSGIEAGPGKIVSELGVQGAIAMILLLWAYLYSLYKILQMRWFGGPIFITAVFLFALILNHLVSFAISHQVYGDPFVAMLTGLMFGMLLALPKMYLAQTRHIRRL